MNIRNKITTILTVLILSLVLASCMNDSQEDERTEAIELAELNQLILTLEGRGFDVDTTQSGIYYLLHEAGEGPLVVPYDTITISYEGYLTDGRLFDATENWAPDGKWEIVYMEQQLIQGFNEALSLMNEGSEYEFLIPSSLAYGAYGSPPNIGPFETLIFGVKLHEIRSSSN